MITQIMQVQPKEKKDWKDYALAGVQALSAASSVYKNIAGAGSGGDEKIEPGEPKPAPAKLDDAVLRRLYKYGQPPPEMRIS